MKKIAIFVEGLTEQEFVIKILSEMAGKKGITFEIKSQFQGKLRPVTMRSVQDPDYYILIVNCCNDNQVKSQIMAQRQSLENSNYSAIIGLRDLHPVSKQDLSKVERFLNYGVPTKGIPISQFIAIMETEAWFIEEHTHYEKLDPTMTIEEIVKKGYDIVSIAGHDWPIPAEVLRDIYAHWGIVYEKRRDAINRTINALSSEELYVTVREKSPSLDNLIACFEKTLFDNVPQPN